MALTDTQKARANKLRAVIDKVIATSADDVAAINTLDVFILDWAEGSYAIGDVRMYNGAPYKCVQAHDSTGNSTWNPTVASLWMQYHGTTQDSARAWVAPTGSHDMYKVGEYMIFTDGNIYKCLVDTVYSPTDYAAAWQIVT